MRKDGHNFEAIPGNTVRPSVKNRKVVFLRSHFLKVTERFFFSSPVLRSMLTLTLTILKIF